jgi:hypothetical protein
VPSAPAAAVPTSTAAGAIPVPPNPTLPAEYTPAFTADKVKVLGQKYTKDEFIQDLNAVITFWSADAPNKMFWDPAAPPGSEKNKIDEFYYAIATALFTFFPDVGFNIKNFYRICICNAHVETTLNPYCAYTPEMMDFIFTSTVSPGILQASPSPQCIGYIHWGRPLMDLSKKIMTTPLPPGTPSPKPGDLKKVGYLRLDNCIYSMLIWGWAQRNLASLCTKATANNLELPRCTPPPTTPYTYQNLCEIWNTGHSQPEGTEIEYILNLHKRWTFAKFPEEEWNTLMKTPLPVIKGIGIDYTTCNVSPECYAWNVKRANSVMDGALGTCKDPPPAVTPDVNSIKPIGPALPIESLDAFIDTADIKNITEIPPLTSYNASDYEFTKYAGNCGNVAATGTNRIGNPVSAEKLAAV